ncbi:MAG: hypothetical protein QOD10_2761, partial [Mycobacterium sp.]|nr:hypothetical protein [Mycobacterium sp.]
MADDLDELHRVKPEDFTALRTKLAAAAKERGDAAAVKQISATRKPTTAAWVVNRLALSDKEAKRRLTELGERLRDAHAAMAGDRIRELSAQQRQLIEDLARAAFDAADIDNPSAALRDDVTDTLQAAIADPDVVSRLGRLAKAERWSGFGGFGDTAQVSTATRGKPKATPKPASQKPAAEAARDDDGRSKARAALTAAERARAQADEALSERQADLATARLRHDDLGRRLRDAERKLDEAECAYTDAKQASRDAA